MAQSGGPMSHRSAEDDGKDAGLAWTPTGLHTHVLGSFRWARCFGICAVLAGSRSWAGVGPVLLRPIPWTFDAAVSRATVRGHASGVLFGRCGRRHGVIRNATGLSPRRAAPLAPQKATLGPDNHQADRNRFRKAGTRCRRGNGHFTASPGCPAIAAIRRVMHLGHGTGSLPRARASGMVRAPNVIGCNPWPAGCSLSR